MASAFLTIGAARAAAKLGIAKGLGVTIALYHQTTGAVTLYARPFDRSIEDMAEGNVRSELQRVSFEIPVQANFARQTAGTSPEPVRLFDKIEWESRAYFVNEITPDPTGYIYVVKCSRAQRVASGA